MLEHSISRVLTRGIGTSHIAPAGSAAGASASDSTRTEESHTSSASRSVHIHAAAVGEAPEGAVGASVGLEATGEQQAAAAAAVLLKNEADAAEVAGLGASRKVCGEPTCTACNSGRFHMTASLMKPAIAAGYYYSAKCKACGGIHGKGGEWPLKYKQYLDRIKANGGKRLVRIVPHFIDGKWVGAQVIALVDFEVGDLMCEIFGWVMRPWEWYLFNRRATLAGAYPEGCLPPFTFCIESEYSLSFPERTLIERVKRNDYAAVSSKY